MPTQVVNGQTIDSLDVFECQNTVGYGNTCCENAAYRITIPGLSVTLCAHHAKKYIKGESKLSPVHCRSCEQICKPGYISEQDMAFCSQACRDFRMAGTGSLTYR